MGDTPSTLERNRFFTSVVRAAKAKTRDVSGSVDSLFGFVCFITAMVCNAPARNDASICCRLTRRVNVDSSVTSTRVIQSVDLNSGGIFACAFLLVSQFVDPFSTPVANMSFASMLRRMVLCPDVKSRFYLRKYTTSFLDDPTDRHAFCWFVFGCVHGRSRFDQKSRSAVRRCLCGEYVRSNASPLQSGQTTPHG